MQLAISLLTSKTRKSINKPWWAHPSSKISLQESYVAALEPFLLKQRSGSGNPEKLIELIRSHDFLFHDKFVFYKNNAWQMT